MGPLFPSQQLRDFPEINQQLGEEVILESSLSRASNEDLVLESTIFPRNLKS